MAIVLAAVAPAQAHKHLGTAGRTFPIVEPDALTEIKEAAARVNWEKVWDKKKMTALIKKYRPKDLQRLPAATENKKFLVDLTYTLNRNIPDGQGGILYPKGYSFNPLDYVNLSSILVVIDGSDRRQVEWFKASPYADDFRCRLLLSDGDFYNLIMDLGRPAFYLSAEIADRLKLAAVPSVVVQQGNKMLVQEILVPDKEIQTEATGEDK